MPRSRIAAFKGNDHPNSKLNEQDVRIIKMLLREDMTQLQIAERFNVAHSTIKAIAQDRTWRHVEVS